MQSCDSTLSEFSPKSCVQTSIMFNISKCTSSRSYGVGLNNWVLLFLENAPRPFEVAYKFLIMLQHEMAPGFQTQILCDLR